MTCCLLYWLSGSKLSFYSEGPEFEAASPQSEIRGKTGGGGGGRICLTKKLLLAACCTGIVVACRAFVQKVQSLRQPQLCIVVFSHVHTSISHSVGQSVRWSVHWSVCRSVTLCISVCF